MMDKEQAILPVSIQLGIQPGLRHTIGRQQIIEKVNELILNDFEKLVSILYRIDVSEKKIHQLLNDFPNEDAATLITDMMIEREAEKMTSRKKFTNKDDGFTGAEKW